MPSVHPRARGEHLGADPVVCGDTGSSPRTRGTFLDVNPVHTKQRFIPAHAGNISCNNCVTSTMSVHPRARGEHFEGVEGKYEATGSSPRTRGTWGGRGPAAGTIRFIPAHAGNMTASVVTRTPWSVHPRARGEHFVPRSNSGRGRGSSPRTRGTFFDF